MPSILPSEERPKVKPFDPLLLDRTAITVPLLKAMQEDLHLIAKVEKTHLTVFQKLNSAIDCWRNELDRELEAPELDGHTILRSL
jgi:hypothetical protein